MALLLVIAYGSIVPAIWVAFRKRWPLRMGLAIFVSSFAPISYVLVTTVGMPPTVWFRLTPLLMVTSVPISLLLIVWGSTAALIRWLKRPG